MASYLDIVGITLLILLALPIRCKEELADDCPRCPSFSCRSSSIGCVLPPKAMQDTSTSTVTCRLLIDGSPGWGNSRWSMLMMIDEMTMLSHRPPNRSTDYCLSSILVPSKMRKYLNDPLGVPLAIEQKAFAYSSTTSAPATSATTDVVRWVPDRPAFALRCICNATGATGISAIRAFLCHSS